MKNLTFQVFVGFLLLAQCNLPGAAKDDKITPEELVSRHVASIGTPEAIAAARSRVTSGTVHVIFRLGGHGDLQGKVNVLSEKDKIRIGMSLPSLDYQGDQVAFDANGVTVGQIQPGRRSPLSEFLHVHEVLMRDGLLGGSSTTAWGLLYTAERKPKLNYTGLKKFGGKQAHELKYKARKGAGDVQVSLYFEPETFRHIGSQFRLAQPAPMATNPAESANQRETVYTIVEQFEDFRQVDGLTLPHRWKLTYTVEGQGTILQDFLSSFDEVKHNSPIDPKYFVVQ